MTITLYDAERCPFCARVRILLAEKHVDYETVAIDLEDRPAWLYEKNPLGKVPVLEEDTLVLPESPVIMEYLEERFPEPSFLPADPGQRALVRLAIERFDVNFGSAYYAFRRGEEGAEERLAHCLALVDHRVAEWPGEYTLADVAYLPWLIRLRGLYGVDLSGYPALSERLETLSRRPAVAAELDVVAALPR